MRTDRILQVLCQQTEWHESEHFFFSTECSISFKEAGPYSSGFADVQPLCPVEGDCALMVITQMVTVAVVIRMLITN